MKKMLLIISLVLAGCATAQQGTVSGYRWMGDPAQHPAGDNPAALAADQCRWEVRQAAMSRQQPTYVGTGGFNDPQMGMAANQLAAALAATPGPALLDECMAAKGWRLEFRH